MEKTNVKVELTRGGKRMIEQAIRETNSVNSHDLLYNICENLEKKFSGDTLEYQAKRMNFETTGDILKAIDLYMYKASKNGVITLEGEETGEGQLAA